MTKPEFGAPLSGGSFSCTSMFVESRNPAPRTNVSQSIVNGFSGSKCAAVQLLPPVSQPAVSHCMFGKKSTRTHWSNGASRVYTRNTGDPESESESESESDDSSSSEVESESDSEWEPPWSCSRILSRRRSISSFQFSQSRKYRGRAWSLILSITDNNLVV